VIADSRGFAVNRSLPERRAGVTRRRSLLLVVAAWLLGACSGPPEPTAGDGLVRVTFATDWRAQAEHGGFYQALAQGYYREAGLDVRILQGGPAVNVAQLLATSTVDFGLGSNAFISMNLAAEGVPVRAVMAIFQKDPQVIITHPREDVTGLADMRGLPIMISDATIGAFWVWLKARFGFDDGQIRRYTFNLAPFLVDPGAIQQGYVTSEPYAIEQALGVPPQVFLLADQGYPGYAALVLANERLIHDHPAVVQAFVTATARGWQDYLHGDPTAGNALILADNPEMTPDLLAHAIGEMKARGLVDSGDAVTQGIGAMTHARWREFHETMAAEGIYPAELDPSGAYTLEFVGGPDGD
jgi:NitT/TauT family transport system substrate-binding protein